MPDLQSRGGDRAAGAIEPGPARLDPEGCLVLVIGRHSQGCIVIEDLAGQIHAVPQEHLTAIDRCELC